MFILKAVYQGRGLERACEYFSQLSKALNAKIKQSRWAKRCEIFQPKFIIKEVKVG
jgi:hypothetical protein